MNRDFKNINLYDIIYFYLNKINIDYHYSHLLVLNSKSYDYSK